MYYTVQKMQTMMDSLQQINFGIVLWIFVCWLSYGCSPSSDFRFYFYLGFICSKHISASSSFTECILSLHVSSVLWKLELACFLVGSDWVLCPFCSTGELTHGTEIWWRRLPFMCLMLHDDLRGRLTGESPADTSDVQISALNPLSWLD